MSAKGVLVNPTLVATDLVNSFDRMQTPEHTEGTEGYIWVTAINSNVSEARVNLVIRDHNKVLFEARKEQIKNAVEFSDNGCSEFVIYPAFKQKLHTFCDF